MLLNPAQPEPEAGCELGNAASIPPRPGTAGNGS